MKDQATQKMIKARAGLILDRPFYGALALKLSLKSDHGLRHRLDRRKNPGSDPAYINSASAWKRLKDCGKRKLCIVSCSTTPAAVTVTRRTGTPPPTRPFFTYWPRPAAPSPPTVSPAAEFKDKTAEQIYGAMGRGREKEPPGTATPTATSTRAAAARPGTDPRTTTRRPRPGPRRRRPRAAATRTDNPAPAAVKSETPRTRTPAPP